MKTVEINFVSQSFALYEALKLFQRFQFWKLYIPLKSQRLLAKYGKKQNRVEINQKMNFVNRTSRVREYTLDSRIGNKPYIIIGQLHRSLHQYYHSQCVL